MPIINGINPNTGLPPIRGKYGPTLAQRIMMRIEYDTNGGCWLWSGDCDRSGYGKTKYDAVTMRMHRASYSVFKGDPGSLQVLHRCDVRACVNPDHLFLGTHADNMRDMRIKGRAGRNRKKHLLTDNQKAEIDRLVTHGVPDREIARKVFCSPTTVRHRRIKLLEVSHG